ncbi:hypothetical protein P691DRAFT_765667 [Macrolepiota fuliginosa MF-IS2]|uniref:Uncharacterized protein n=1 Tax=Macrolepiota fuliginosa MF-IS2 TaxID=1400762 RepID=A0A9P5X345_9AGAR|nr:hypothetical protein P691DRAFT_765667 [Macrolepiota fuliginosa MF-IS2]
MGTSPSNTPSTSPPSNIPDSSTSNATDIKLTSTMASLSLKDTSAPMQQQSNDPTAISLQDLITMQLHSAHCMDELTVAIQGLSTQPGSKSLYDLFPYLEAATLIEIAHHEFKPTDLYKLDARYCDKTELECSQGSASCTGSWKNYPTLNSLIVPLQMYFHILTWFAANEGDVELTATIATGGLKYIGHILLLNNMNGMQSSNIIHTSTLPDNTKWLRETSSTGATPTLTSCLNTS